MLHKKRFTKGLFTKELEKKEWNEYRREEARIELRQFDEIALRDYHTEHKREKHSDR